MKYNVQHMGWKEFSEINEVKVGKYPDGEGMAVFYNDGETVVYVKSSHNETSDVWNDQKAFEELQQEAVYAFYEIDPPVKFKRGQFDLRELEAWGDRVYYMKNLIIGWGKVEEFNQLVDEWIGEYELKNGDGLPAFEIYDWLTYEPFDSLTKLGLEEYYEPY